MKRRFVLYNLLAILGVRLFSGRNILSKIISASSIISSSKVSAYDSTSDPIGKPFNIIIGYGQSNMTGRQYTSKLETHFSIHPRMLMFKSAKSSVRFPPSGEGVKSYEITGFTSLRSTVSTSLQQGATSLEGIAKRISMDCDILTDQSSSLCLSEVLFFSAAKGGYSIDQLGSGSKAYQSILEGIQTSKRLLNKSAAINVPFLIFSQGESDTGNRNWSKEVRKLHRNLTNDINKITGLNHRLRFIMTQLSSFGGYNSALQHLKLVEDDPETFFIATPGYALPYFSDNVHYNSVGNIKKGEYEFKVIKALNNGYTWTGLRPKKVYLEESIIELECYVPVPPLVHDSSLVDIDEWGFSVFENGKNIELLNIEIITSTRIRLVTKSVLKPGTHKTLSYGTRSYQRIENKRIDGTGPGGQLRDSDSMQSFIDGNPLYNWMVHFSIAI